MQHPVNTAPNSRQGSWDSENTVFRLNTFTVSSVGACVLTALPWKYDSASVRGDCCWYEERCIHTSIQMSLNLWIRQVQNQNGCLPASSSSSHHPNIFLEKKPACWVTLCFRPFLSGFVSMSKFSPCSTARNLKIIWQFCKGCWFFNACSGKLSFDLGHSWDLQSEDKIQLDSPAAIFTHWQMA